MSGLWQWFIGLFESSLVTTLIGAAIGGYATFYAVQYEIKNQNEADQKKEAIEEQNKMRYLLFLIEDIYPIVDTYDVAATSFVNNVAQNIYYIPAMPGYSSYSLEAIVSKINQEQYYLSALRQLRNPNFTEVFRLLNSLGTIYREAKEYYREQYPLLIQEKLDFGEGANTIPSILSSFMNGPQLLYGVPTEVRSMYDDCVALFNAFPGTLDLNRLDGLDPLLIRLEQYSKNVTIDVGGHWKQIASIIDKKRRYQGRMMNVPHEIIRYKGDMNSIKASIIQHAASLKQYINALPA